MTNSAMLNLPVSDKDIDSLWQKFESKFPNESSCLKYLCRLLLKHRGVKCSGCGSGRFKRVKTKRILFCKNCNYSFWYTAGTIFERAHNVRPYLAALWFFHKGAMITSTKFQKLTGLNQSTSWIILKKVSIAIYREKNDQEMEEICISRFADSIYKRSSHTPAKLSPREELINDIAVDTENLNSVNDSPQSTNLSTEHKTIYDLIEGGPVHEETLLVKTDFESSKIALILLDLQFEGLLKQVDSGRYQRTSSWIVSSELNAPHLTEQGSKKEKSDSLVKGYNHFFRMTFHGLSKKYFQLYIFHCSYLSKSLKLIKSEKWRDFISGLYRKGLAINTLDVNGYMTLNKVAY